VAAYEAKRAEARAAAHEVVEAARSTIEAERTDRVAAANAEIAQRRAAAMAEVDAAREAARGEVEAAVASVTASLAERALGQRVTDEAVARAVSATSTIGAGR
jgi:F-type H+-transporting ATPase subunit b